MIVKYIHLIGCFSGEQMNHTGVFVSLIRLNEVALWYMRLVPVIQGC